MQLAKQTENDPQLTRIQTELSKKEITGEISPNQSFQETAAS
jgi:hypothetical protein